MDTSDCCHELRLAEWLQDFRPIWDHWQSGLAELHQEGDDELERSISLSNKLRSLTQVALRQAWEATSYATLWEQAFSGLAAVVHNLERAAQLALQQETPMLWVAITESMHVLCCPLLCLQLCQQEYLRSMPAVHQQQRKALSHIFLTAGPQLLLRALAAERSNDGQGECTCMPQLAFALQDGTRELLQPSLTAVLKRSERSTVMEGVGRLIDALELALREGCLNSWRRCILFDNMPYRHFCQQACHQPPSSLLLEAVAAKPSRAALAFRCFAGGVHKLACYMEADAKRPDAREGPPFWKGDMERSATTYLASMVDLSSSFKPNPLPQAAASDPSLLGEVCSALSALSAQVEAAHSAGSLVEGGLLKSWAGAWEACASVGLQPPASLPYIKRLLGAAASMVRIAASLGGWEQQGRSWVSNSISGVSLREELPHIWKAACRLAEQAATYLYQYDGTEQHPAGSAQVALVALQHALSLLGNVAAIWQWCHNSRSRAVWGTRQDLRPSLTQLSRSAAMASSELLFTLLDPDLDLELLRLLCKDHYSALMGTLSLALQVQVKAVRALEIEWDSWGDSGLAIAHDLSHCLSLTLKLMSAAFSLKPREESVATGQCAEGGCWPRWPPAAPYLRIIPAVQTLFILGKQMPGSIKSSVYDGLAEVLCWLLIHQGNSALHAGAGWLLAGCAEPYVVPQVLRKLRASEGAAAALGGILLVGSRLAKRLGARNPELGGMQSERQLSMDATNVLKRCCAIIDTEYGTNFAARDAECEWEGAQLLGGLLRLGLPSAADTCEPGESWCYPPL